MFKLFRGRSRIVVLAIFVIVLGAAVYGFAAANTVPTSNAGEGQDTISGYVVTGVAYTLNSSNPAGFSQVDFNLFLSDGSTNAPDTTTVYAGVGDGTTTYWASCTDGTLPAWSCDLSGSTVDVHDATEFHVAATH